MERSREICERDNDIEHALVVHCEYVRSFFYVLETFDVDGDPGKNKKSSGLDLGDPLHRRYRSFSKKQAQKKACREEQEEKSRAAYPIDDRSHEGNYTGHIVPDKYSLMDIVVKKKAVLNYAPCH